jgi:hypothetical protein
MCVDWVGTAYSLCKLALNAGLDGLRKMFLLLVSGNSIEVDAKTKESTGKTEKNWIDGIKKAMNGRNLKEGQWEDGEQWSLGVGQRRETFLNRR